MKKLILLALLIAFGLAKARYEVIYEYDEPSEYVEEIVYEEPACDYVEEIWLDEPVYTSRRYSRPCYKQVVYERPIVRETRYVANPIANFFSGLVGFALGTAVGAATSDK